MGKTWWKFHSYTPTLTNHLLVPSPEASSGKEGVSSTSQLGLWETLTLSLALHVLTRGS